MEKLKELLSKRKNLVLLTIIFIIGLTLRIINADNLDVLPDNLLMVLPAINFISSGLLEVFHQSTGLWYYTTDFFYKIFGVGQLGSRMPALLFGSFSIIIIFLIVKRLFNSNKAALFAALLLATDPFHITETVAEMDAFITFFLLFSLYFLIEFFHEKKSYYLILSFALLGMSMMSKIYTVLFIIPYAIILLSYYWIYEKEVFSKKNTKLFFILGLTLLVFLFPMIVHNYLLYQDKGIVDLQFTRVFGIGSDISKPYYEWTTQFDKQFSLIGSFFGQESFFNAVIAILKISPLIFILGLIGMIFLYIDNKKTIFYPIVLLFIPLIYIASVIFLPKHFLFFNTIMIIPASYLIEKIIIKFNQIEKKIIFSLIILIIVLHALLLIQHPFYLSKAPINQIMEDTNQFEKDSVIIVDPRLYTGQMHWIFYNQNYISVLDFMELVNKQQNLTEQDVIKIKIYFVECAATDCGWGTIKDNQQLNLSMQSFFSDISSDFKLKETINSSRYYYGNKEEYFKLYEGNLVLPKSIFNYITANKAYWLYPIGYENPYYERFDKFALKSDFDTFLYSLAKLILLFSLILEFLFIIYSIILLKRLN